MSDGEHARALRLEIGRPRDGDLPDGWIMELWITWLRYRSSEYVVSWSRSADGVWWSVLDRGGRLVQQREAALDAILWAEVKGSDE